jgi:hypothetical protein
LEERISVLEQSASATVSSLHRIRMRTSRVLAATSAFMAVQRDVASLSRVIRTASGLSRLSEDSVDRAPIERELARLKEELEQLHVRFSRELLSAAEAELGRPAARSKRWWRFWR